MADGLVKSNQNGMGNHTTLPLDDWRARAEALLQNPKLETVEGEQELEKLTLDLRQHWLRHAHELSSTCMLSPLHKQRIHLPVGGTVAYPYDRWVKPEFLENKLNALRPVPKGWTASSILFASGMAALTTTLQVFRNRAKRVWELSNRPLSIHWFGGYFEIDKAFRVLCDDSFYGRRHANQKDLRTAVESGVADLVLIEPIAADIDLELFDLDAFVQAWKRRPAGRPCVVVVDTSLCGAYFPMDRFCRALESASITLVAEIRSGLKLDQEGFEFSNAGLLTLWAQEVPKNLKNLKLFDRSLRLARTTLGTSLSQYEYAALSVPFFLNHQSHTQYACAVFENNRLLAQTLGEIVDQNSGFLYSVNHPSLSENKDKSWAVAPYVNLRYGPGDKRTQVLMGKVLEYEAHVRKLCFQSGSSFGFRGHRYEMGFVRGLENNSIRITMGARSGPSRDGIIELLQELATYSDYTALRQAYPHLDAKTPKVREDQET